MTSSLVGSEMCIRDREKVPGANFSGNQGLEAAMGRMSQEKKTIRTFPVSYTHLTLPTICSV
eukprot:10630188-Prorocentrum_lima.AAC.1